MFNRSRHRYCYIKVIGFGKPSRSKATRRTDMKRLLFWTVILSTICFVSNISYARNGGAGDYDRSGKYGGPNDIPPRGYGDAQKVHYGHPRGPWGGSYYRPYYRPYYYPWYGPYYRPLPRYYYAPAPVYVYPPPPVIYAPPPPAVIIPNPPPPPPPPPAPRPDPPPQPAPASTLQPIYFDLNKSNIRPEAEKTLKQNLEWFRQNPGKKVSIQGNCDPRATEHYNISLGKKRAEAVKHYLISHGVDAKLLDAVSFGKELSTCRGKDESCWAKERRVDFVPSP